MKDFLRDDFKYKEIPPIPQEKGPSHHLICDFAYFYRYEHQYLSELFFGKSMAPKYPTYYLPTIWTYVQNL